jgi:hypothetical protein
MSNVDPATYRPLQDGLRAAGHFLDSNDRRPTSLLAVADGIVLTQGKMNRLRCRMCLMCFVSDRAHGGRIPRYRPECRARWRAENARLRMARLRARRRPSAQTSAAVQA